MEQKTKKIKVGLTAFGMSGQVFHAPFIANNSLFELTAIVERTQSFSREKYPESKLYRSVNQLLTDDEIDLVVINTPVQTHFEYAKEALLAKKNVLVEKPFTVDAFQAEELQRIAELNGCKLSIYQNRRYDGDFLKVKEIIESGVLGDIKEVEIRFDRFRSQISQKNHKETSEKGGGALHDLGAHLIDQALLLFGFPQKMYADLGYLRKNTKTNDYFELLFFYEDGLRVRVKSSTFALERQYEYVIHGENGSFLQQRFDIQEDMLSKGSNPSTEKWLSEVTKPNGILRTLSFREETIAQHGNYMNFYNDLYNYLIFNAKNPASPLEAIDVMKIIDEALKN